MEIIPRLRIDSLAFKGDGVGHLDDGRAVFVPGTCPGDVVSATVMEDRKSYLRAAITDILEPSPDRVRPRCPHFGTCGGCQWQHIAYDAQARAKEQIVQDSLERIGHIDHLLVEPIECATGPYGYRNKIELHALSSPRLRLGFLASGSNTLVDIDECHLIEPIWRTAPKSLRGALRYASGQNDLGLDRVVLRTARNTSDHEVALWGRPTAAPRAMIARTIVGAVDRCSVTRVLIRPDARKKIRGVEVLSGPGHWRERLGDFEYTVSSPSFFQVNTTGAEQLIQIVMEMASPGEGDLVLDAYSGVGTFTLPLAASGADVLAAESSGHAIRDLRRNLDENGLDAEVLPGDIARTAADFPDLDIVVLDPPRAGLQEDVVAAIAKTSPKRLVYVSCDPTTLARDSARLQDCGFRATRVKPVDLFPQTYHVECVALFEST